MSKPEVEIRLNTRRRKTIRGFIEAGRIIIEAPAHLPQAELEREVDSLVARIQRRRTPADDQALHERAEQLFEIYLVPGVAGDLPTFGIRWVSNQTRRWGSCTPDTGAIRISDRVRQMPTYVQDYVLLHELTHLFERTHNARFKHLMSAYPDLGRAESFLAGYALAAAWEPRG